TPAYMAPEQVLPQLGPVSPRSDLYSLAVVLFRLVAGRLPAEGGVMEVLFQLGHGEAPPPSRFRPGIDPALDAIIHKALARRQDQRHADLAAFAGALRGWLHNAASRTTTAELAL